jgi:hypothetical protein
MATGSFHKNIARQFIRAIRLGSGAIGKVSQEDTGRHGVWSYQRPFRFPAAPGAEISPRATLAFKKALR